jgi:small subunit ribosomal protein S4
MARYTGPKNKLSRQVGEDLSLKTNTLKHSGRLGIRPGQHGSKGRRKLSSFAIQLKEKQKLKYLYGILEKQLGRLYEEASKNPTATGSALLGLLERRLDNVVYRLGLAPTRAAARQLVGHGHVSINGRKLNIASYRVNVGEIVTLSEKALGLPVLVDRVKEIPSTLPAWLERKAAVGKVARLPERSDIMENISEQLVVEFYSR